MATSNQILRLELPDATAANGARSAVARLTADLRALDRADVLLLVTELIGIAAPAAGSSGAILQVARLDNALEFSAEGPGIRPDVDPMVAALFDQLADEWRVERGAARFTIARPAIFVDSHDEETLFQRLQSGEDAPREELAQRYEPFALSLVSKYVRSSTKRKDLEQVARLGLLKALERFEPSRQVKFTTYAARTINGELKRFLRDKGWSIRVPRGLQELGLEARRAAESASQIDGKPPTLDELASSIDADPTELGQAMLAHQSFDTVSLDAPVGGDAALSLGAALPTHDDRLHMAPEWAEISSAMEDLPERERKILYLRFFEDLSQSDIAERVGISQMHVSRLLAQSIDDLRLWIGISEEQAE